MKTRIVETSRGFVPQVKKTIFGRWQGVDGYISWSALENQLDLCSFETRDEAQEALNKFSKRYNEFLEEKKRGEEDKRKLQ